MLEEAGVPRVEVALGIDRLGGRVGALVVLLEQHGPAHEHLAVAGDLDLDARGGLADGVEFNPAVGLQADVSTRFRRSIELLEIHADRAIETKQIGPDRRTRGVRDADATHAEHIAQRSEHEHVAEPVMEAFAPRHRLAVENIGAAAPGHAREIVEQPALDRARILHADHHLRQQVLEDPRRREIVRRADLAHVGHHRFAGFRTVDRESRIEPLRVRKQVIADPCHWQIREHAVGRGQAVELATTLGRRDESRM